jgi:hypothetical protein
VGSFGWPKVFADANYATTCQILGSASGSGEEGAIVKVATQGTGAIGIELASVTAAAVTVPQISCIAVHQ